MLKSEADCEHAAVFYCYCSVCGKKGTETFESGKPLGHNYESVYTKPTRTSNGYTTHTCTRCQHSYVEYDDPDTTIRFLLGDLNGDGTVNGRDYMMLKRAVLKTLTLTDEQKAAGDMDGSNTLTAKDYMFLKRTVLRKA